MSPNELPARHPGRAAAQQAVHALRQSYNAGLYHRRTSHHLLSNLVPLIRAWRAAEEPSGPGTFSHALYARRFGELRKFVEATESSFNGGSEYSSSDAFAPIRNVMDCELPLPASSGVTTLRRMLVEAAEHRVARTARVAFARKEFLESLTVAQMALLIELGQVHAPRRWG